MHSCPCRRQKKHRFNPWVKQIPWRRKWPLTLVFLPGESHEQRSLAPCSPWGCKELEMTEHFVIKHSKNIVHICKHTHTHTQIYIYTLQSVQLLSRVQLFVTLWTAACQASLSITNSQSWLILMSIESLMPSNHLILCHPSRPVFNFAQHQGLFQ